MSSTLSTFQQSYDFKLFQFRLLQLYIYKFWSNNYIEYKCNNDINKTVSVEEYLNKIRPYLRYIINNLKKYDTLKTQLTNPNNFISSLDNDENRVMHSKSDNTEIMINDEEDEIIEQLFDSVKNRYQNNLESMRSSESVFDYVCFIVNAIKQL